LGSKKFTFDNDEDDRISALAFDKNNGQFLSVGDHEGRILIFRL
jgi:hypothetical protein